MSKQITIYTDYVCPYCLLAEHIIEEAIQGQDVEINWRPYELRPEPVPTLRVEDPYLPQIWKQSVYPMAERLGVPIKLPAISPQPRTDKAFEVFAMADEQGLGHAFSMRALKAFFQEEKDIGNPEILADLGAEVGLERESVLSALAKGTYRERHREALRHAREDMTITSVPTIVVGKQVFRGVPLPGELRRALEQVSIETGHEQHLPDTSVAGNAR
ncbi:DsbA family protein [Halomonas sp. McH1-25]|uniref:DsbA family oxidoreductase n=1 Tax=unclassified Halomonas TaxID=2609666 RepID=UPI001EF41CC7|nr:MULTISPECIES: DsbA family protein [unclassified Halomonas]MCG7598248.1 DsbA family protein [Halomonas sp. McH1-25]MCP1340969.1 DsbA family protein [Halomonas sp. FL8]MCP1361453.1 DsbA family protein [Halomonas sp. BBD45]MCP1363948.1 DsbA family protein [Halomonas sp. BBD48]